MIFKLQKAIAYGNDILIYNEERDIMFQLPLSEDLNKLFGKSFKIYCDGFVDKKGIFNINKKVKSQDW